MSDPLRGEEGRQGSGLPFGLKMAFQPIVDVAGQRVWGYEALVRGAAGEPAADVLARVDADNRYRFDQACRVTAIETAAKLFPREQSVKLCINFMPNAVYDPADCLKAASEAAERCGVPREDILFEFTEAEEIADVGHIARIVDEYRRQGYMTAIDDFGAGYAGLNLLARFQPDVVKLDMELVRGIEASEARQVIVAAVMWMTRQLGVTVLAVGVETEAELRVLRAAGVSLFQGYYFARPALEALPPLSLGAQLAPPQLALTA